MPYPPYTQPRPIATSTPTTAVHQQNVQVTARHYGHGPVVQPGRPAAPPAPVHGPVYPPSQPPPAHQRHHDYAYVEGWGWWPTWFPYWDQSWFAYWNYLYDYYGGDANPDYAEYYRDAIMRQMAAQQGWLSY